MKALGNCMGWSACSVEARAKLKRNPSYQAALDLQIVQRNYEEARADLPPLRLISKTSDS